jgi:hypothetical protein
MDYTELVASLAEKYGIPNELAQRWVMKESGFDESAVNSRTGATGLTQIMPRTAADPGYGVAPLAAEELMDPEANLEFGMQYLAAMKEKFGNWEDALRAYNAGPGSVERSRNFAETNDYVAAILGDSPIERAGGAVSGSGEYFGGMSAAELEELLALRMKDDDDRKAAATMRALSSIQEALDNRSDVAPLELPVTGIRRPGNREYDPLRWLRD